MNYAKLLKYLPFMGMAGGLLLIANLIPVDEPRAQIAVARNGIGAAIANSLAQSSRTPSETLLQVRNLVFSAGDKRRRGDYQGAIADYTKLIELKPDYESAYTNRGNVRSQLGDYGGAILDYTEVIKLKPKQASAYHNRGLAWRAAGNHEGAIADFTEAIKLDSDSAYSYFQRGLSRADLKDRQGAIADLQIAANLFRQFTNPVMIKEVDRQLKAIQSR